MTQAGFRGGAASARGFGSCEQQIAAIGVRCCMVWQGDGPTRCRDHSFQTGAATVLHDGRARRTRFHSIMMCLNKLLRPFFAAILAAVLAAPVFAAQAPSPETIQAVVEAAVQAGRFAQADRAIAVVLAAHPDSATVHYVDARLLADEGKWPLAQAELQRAEHLDPAAGFEQPQALKAFTARVQAHVQAGPVKSSSTGLIVLASAFILTFVYLMIGIFRARKREVASRTDV